MLNGKRILAVTLARGGSKSVPRKNIADVHGKPLIQYTIDEVNNSSYIDQYLVSTDDEQIKSICETLGAYCPFLRPAEFSTDTATSADAVIHAVTFMQNLGEEFDYVVEVMATNPLKITADIDECIKLAVENNVDACVAVNRVYDQHPARLKYIEDGFLKSFYPEIPESRRQDLTPEAFIRSGSIYVTETNFLLKNKARYSKDTTLAYIIPDERVINIDTLEDLELARIKLT